jgi:hypothetical protein
VLISRLCCLIYNDSIAYNGFGFLIFEFAFYINIFIWSARVFLQLFVQATFLFAVSVQIWLIYCVKTPICLRLVLKRHPRQTKNMNVCEQARAFCVPCTESRASLCGVHSSKPRL